MDDNVDYYIYIGIKGPIRLTFTGYWNISYFKKN